MANFQLQKTLSLKTKVIYKEFVYNNQAFLATNNKLEKRHFYWVDTNIDCAHAHVAFSITDETAYSPHRLPFGGVELAEGLVPQDLFEFLSQVEKTLVIEGVKVVRLHQAPNAYQDQTLIGDTLIQLGYETIQNRVFHTIAVNETDLYDRMHKMEHRKFKMCHRDGAIFRELKKKQKIEAFQWIERNRNLAYKPPSMSWVDLQEASQRNPKVYKVFGVFLDDWMLAATVAVVVNDRAIYHFMPASQVDFREYKKYSPMVFLINELYNWCRSNGIETLDLGTSYVDMKLKDSLVKFKENTGGKPCNALSWQKTLSS
ncbi:GNAT family N-acetyltransferase [Roseivirga misakiensis]|uniref:BioF2-like acetyltransferase domain-containing protein n=1 Tax=Roseivirga misakiensis TaxID=1563681 RepID=A0A1E5SL68_9BACT|nr:GNAT family N-acetyltransferase [Roseivirga misakiensis]OEJ99875.1 hypothetical protein BFP71_10020 [Roseivirga misakiensis]